jgi:mannose-6-phosphate isomerase-like protein (cupin superfamily)
MEVPASRLVLEHTHPAYVQAEADAEWVAGPGYSSRYLDHIHGSGVIENYLLRLDPVPEAGRGSDAVSEPHPIGTLEHLYVISGKVRVGPVDHAVELTAGDFTRYPADRPHVYHSLDGQSVVHIVVSVPQVQPGTGAGQARMHGGGTFPGVHDER